MPESPNVLAVLREFASQTGWTIPDDRLNPNGGAVALGHPLSDEGFVDLIHVDVVRLEACSGDGLGEGASGGDSHDGGVDGDGR